jgi:predicted transcriptional regulator
VTVGALIAKLREHDPEREVMLSVAIDEDVYDAEPIDVYMQAGYIFVSAAE